MKVGDDYLELVDALEISGLYFARVMLKVDGIKREYQFGIHQDSYAALRNILSTRLSDRLSSERGRFYYNGQASAKSPSSDKVEVSFLVIQGRDSRALRFPLLKELCANLKWLRELTLADLDSADHLRVYDC